MREKVAQACGTQLPEAFEQFAFAAGLEAWMQAVFACNAYVDEQAPWALRKTDPDRMTRVLATLCGCIRDLAIAVSPVVPNAAAKILDALSVPDDARDFAALDNDPALGAIVIDNPRPVFPRLEVPETNAV